MYTKRMIETYGESLPDEKERNRFLELTAAIEFTRDGTREVCGGLAVAQALEGSEVEHLAEDFGQNFFRFTEPEDLGMTANE